jgi:hypothetical protein
MPRPPRSHDRSRDDRDEERPRTRPVRRNLDADVVALRETGRSYGAVAASLGLKRAMDAHAVFVRAVRALPESERAEMVHREAGRLDGLEARIRSRDGAEPAKMARRLEAVDALRQSLR